MSDLHAIGMMMAISLGNMVIYYIWSRHIYQQASAVISGVVDGVPLSKEHRLYILQEPFLFSVSGIIGFQIMLAAGFAVIGRVAHAEVQLFAYFNASVAFVPNLLVIGASVATYRRLKGMLPQQD